MKKLSLLLILALIACGQSPKAPKTSTFSKGQIDTVSYLLGINFGSYIRGNNFGENINLSELYKGLNDFLHAEGNMRDENFTAQFKVNPEGMMDIFNDYLGQRYQELLSANKVAEEAFLEANRKKADVHETASGLQYRILAPGNKVKPGPSDKVLVHY